MQGRGGEPELSSSIQYIKGVGPQLAKVLTRKGIRTIEDALYFLPRTYEDRSRLTPIRDLVPGTSATPPPARGVSPLAPPRAGAAPRFSGGVAPEEPGVFPPWCFPPPPPFGG